MDIIKRSYYKGFSITLCRYNYHFEYQVRYKKVVIHEGDPDWNFSIGCSENFSIVMEKVIKFIDKTIEWEDGAEKRSRKEEKDIEKAFKLLT